MATEATELTEGERAAILTQINAAIDTAPEPGNLKAKNAINAGGPADPIRDVFMVGRSVSSAGYVYIYDTVTGDRSVTNRNMLPSQLRKRRDDGTLMFSERKPSVTPHLGVACCPLHPGHERREEFAALGFPTCNKHNLLNPYEVEQHFKHRHPREYAALEKIQTDADRTEERAWRRAVVRQATDKETGKPTGNGHKQEEPAS